MSTNGVILRRSAEVTGVYHHWDSYPTLLGKTLWTAFHGFFQRDAVAMLAYFIDAHPAGWSTVNGADFAVEAGYAEHPKRAFTKSHKPTAAYKRYLAKPKCYCHGIRSEEANPFSLDSLPGSGIEWAYVIDPSHATMEVYDVGIGVTLPVITIDLFKTKEPDWERIECGTGFERCSHIASKHFPGLEKSPSGRLCTRTYLGMDPLEFHDAYAYRINGREFKKTGNGYSSRLARDGKKFPPGLWIETLVDDNNERLDLPVAYQKDGKMTPYKGVAPIFPPTVQSTLTEQVIANRVKQPSAHLRRFR